MLICCVNTGSSQDLERGMSKNLMTDYSNGEKFANLLAVLFWICTFRIFVHPSIALLILVWVRIFIQVFLYFLWPLLNGWSFNAWAQNSASHFCVGIPKQSTWLNGVVTMLQLQILNFYMILLKKVFLITKSKSVRPSQKNIKSFFTFIYYQGAAVKQDYLVKYLLSGPVTSARTRD